MKILHSTTENTWYSIEKVELTPEQLELLNSGTLEEREEISAIIKAGITKTPTKKDSDLAKSLYNANKPTGTFTLIMASINIEDSTGFINYKAEEEHKQLSF